MSSTEHSDYDKETLIPRGDQEAQVSSNIDDELNTQQPKEGRQALVQREALLASERNHDQTTTGAGVDVEKDGGATTTKEKEDPNIVWWDGPDDPADPLNWSNMLKVINVGLVSCLCLVTPLASCKS